MSEVSFQKSGKCCTVEMYVLLTNNILICHAVPSQFENLSTWQPNLMTHLKF